MDGLVFGVLLEPGLVGAGMPEADPDSGSGLGATDTAAGMLGSVELGVLDGAWVVLDGAAVELGSSAYAALKPAMARVVIAATTAAPRRTD